MPSRVRVRVKVQLRLGSVSGLEKELYTHKLVAHKDKDLSYLQYDPYMVV